VEHLERQEEREKELRGDADQLEQQGDEMEQRSGEFEEQIGDVREEYERKQQSSDVPGAQEPDKLADTSGSESEESHSSDVDARPGSSDTPGAADDEGQATGNPPADDSPAADDEDQ
jgi:hypothetical protein